MAALNFLKFTRIVNYRASNIRWHSTTINPSSAIEDALHAEGLTDEINYSNVRKISPYLLEKGATESQLLLHFTKCPKLTKIEFKHWERTVHLFEGYGLSISEILNAVHRQPLILGFSAERILNSLNSLENAGIPTDKIISFILGNPQFLNLKPNEIQQRVTWLRSLFTNKEVRKLVKTCPNLLIEPADEIEQKVIYFVNEMGLEQPKIVSNHALLHSFEHIHWRHQFLVRCGFYVKPNPKNPKNTNNPHLKLILNTTDEGFATKIAKVSVKEYQFFRHLANENKKFLERREVVANDSDEEFSDEEEEDNK